MKHPIENLIGSAILLAALLLFLSGMVLRQLPQAIGSGWISEITIYLVVWGVMLSASGCVAEREHIRVDFFLRLFGKRLQFIAGVLAALVGFVFCLTLAWFGADVVRFAFAWDERGPSYLQFPTAWYYLALPVSLAFCSLRYLLEIVRLLRQGSADMIE